MHPLLLIIMLPALALPGATGPADAGAPDIDAADPVLEQTGLGEASAQANATAAGLGVDVQLDDTGLFLQTRLPGPGFSHPVSGSAGSSATASSGAESTEPASSEPATPIPLPEPKETAGAAGVAAVGVLAYAAFRLRTIGPWILLPLYSRLSNNELLENEVRAKLHQLITEEPGLSLQELSDAVDAGWGNTVYHLQRLEQAGFVKSEKQGHHRRFYKAGDVAQEEIEALGMLRNDNPQRIAQYIVENPGSRQKDVCEALGISASLAHKYLKRMEDQELVTSEREWRSKHYTPDERLAELVQQAA